MVVCMKIAIIVMMIFLCIYILVNRIAQCVEYCAFAKAYATITEAGIEMSAKELKNTIEHAVKREL